MLRGQIHTNLPPEHPIITIWNNRTENGRRIGKKVYSFCMFFTAQTFLPAHHSPSQLFVQWQCPMVAFSGLSWIPSKLSSDCLWLHQSFQAPYSWSSSNVSESNGLDSKQKNQQHLTAELLGTCTLLSSLKELCHWNFLSTNLANMSSLSFVTHLNLS